MDASSFALLHTLLTRRRGASYHPQPPKPLLHFMPATLALATSLLILLYISSTSNLFAVQPPRRSDHRQNPSSDFPFYPPKSSDFTKTPPTDPHGSSKHPFHDKDTFLKNYDNMNKTLKIFIYPHKQNDPFANILLPVDSDPTGNYASESYFKKSLSSSHFTTTNPAAADLFFLPFSIARLRHDPRVGINGIKDFIHNYISNISHNYPYWNSSGGSDHFYVACHSITRSAMEKAFEVKANAIQVVCSSSYYVSSYIAHKDVSLPQIWPRKDQPNLNRLRSKLVFFSGSKNSPVREKLRQSWENDTEISVHFGRLQTSYSEELMRSKFCLHVKGFEVNTARIGDALYYGCVPVVIANHYDLPFQDIFDWRSFSVVVATLDIPLLKKILRGISDEEYLILRKNSLDVREHFQWHNPPVDYDAFYLVMYELWLRRSSLRLDAL